MEVSKENERKRKRKRKRKKTKKEFLQECRREELTMIIIVK